MTQISSTLYINIAGNAPPPTDTLVLTPNPLTLRPGYTEQVRVSLSSGPLPMGSVLNLSWLGNNHGLDFLVTSHETFSVMAPNNVPQGTVIALSVVTNV